MNNVHHDIAARWLFDLEPTEIDGVVLPQSTVHAMAEFRDGSLDAVLAIPAMSIPVAYALSHPDLLELSHLPRLDLAAQGSLTFEPPDMGRFPCLRLAFDALAAGGTMPAVANAANEVAVARFLDGDIAFLDIPRVIEAAMHAHTPRLYDDVGDLLDADAWARSLAAEFPGGRAAAGG